MCPQRCRSGADARHESSWKAPQCRRPLPPPQTAPRCRAIAQGCSEYNITCLIDQKDSIRALRAVHGRFYLDALPIGIGLVGPGLIGGTFLNQLRDQVGGGYWCMGGVSSCWASVVEAPRQVLVRAGPASAAQLLLLAVWLIKGQVYLFSQAVELMSCSFWMCFVFPQAEKLREDYQVDVRVLGVVDSTRMVLCDKPMDLADWKAEMERHVSSSLDFQCGMDGELEALATGRLRAMGAVVLTIIDASVSVVGSGALTIRGDHRALSQSRTPPALPWSCCCRASPPTWTSLPSTWPTITCPTLSSSTPPPRVGGMVCRVSGEMQGGSVAGQSPV